MLKNDVDLYIFIKDLKFKRVFDENKFSFIRFFNEIVYNYNVSLYFLNNVNILKCRKFNIKSRNIFFRN